MKVCGFGGGKVLGDSFFLCEKMEQLFNPGLRISNPTRMTFLPSSARLRARLEAMKVLPSPLMVEVTRTTFLSGSPIMKSRLVRRLRKVSVMMSLSFSRTAMADSSCLFEPVRGMSPIMGTFVSFSTSVCPSMRKRSRFNRKMMPKGMPMPMTKAII